MMVSSTTAASSTGVAGATGTAGVTGVEPEEPVLVPIPGTGKKVEIPIWVEVLMGYICILILILGLAIAWLLYQLGKSLEEHERRCRGRRHWWQRLFCWLITVLKWLVWIIAVAVIVAAIILMIYCFIYFWGA